MRGGPPQRGERIGRSLAAALTAGALGAATLGCGSASTPAASEQAQLGSGATSPAPGAGSSTAPASPGSSSSTGRRPSGSAPGGSSTSSSGGAGGRVQKLESRPKGEGSTTTVADPSLVRQWASSAEASSNYGAAPGDGWNASQATGPPDVDPACGDDGRAWASAESNEVAVLEVHFDQAVDATELNVHQTFNPTQVTRLDLLGPGGEVTTVYEGPPNADGSCPVTGYLRGLDVGHPVDGIAITVDQTVLGLGWAEIDAVELVGRPTA